MPQPKIIHAVAAMNGAAVFIQRSYDASSPLVPGPSPAAVEMQAASAAVQDLLDAIKHEGSMRAINAGRKVVEWRNHIGPVLRAAYARIAGDVDA